MKRFFLLTLVALPLHASDDTPDQTDISAITRGPKLDKDAEYGLLMRQMSKDLEQFTALQNQFVGQQLLELKTKAEQLLVQMEDTVPSLARCLTCTPDYPSLRKRSYESSLQLLGQIIEDIRQHNRALIAKLSSHSDQINAAITALHQYKDTIINQLHVLQRKHRAKMRDTGHKILSLYTSAQIKQFIDVTLDKLERTQEQITEKVRQDFAYILRAFEQNTIAMCMECGAV